MNTVMTVVRLLYVRRYNSTAPTQLLSNLGFTVKKGLALAGQAEGLEWTG